MEVSIKRTNNKFQLEASNSEADSILISAGTRLDDTAKGFRPMQLLLVSLSTCMAIDVLNLLYKQRQRVDDFSIQAVGARKDAIPATFETIQIEIYVEGEVKEEKLAHAIQLSEEKYCSVHHMVSPPAQIFTKYYLNHGK